MSFRNMNTVPAVGTSSIPTVLPVDNFPQLPLYTPPQNAVSMEVFEAEMKRSNFPSLRSTLLTDEEMNRRRDEVRVEFQRRYPGRMIRTKIPRGGFRTMDIREDRINVDIDQYGNATRVGNG
jgi:hypothetical protein